MSSIIYTGRVSSEPLLQGGRQQKRLIRVPVPKLLLWHGPTELHLLEDTDRPENPCRKMKLTNDRIYAQQAARGTVPQPEICPTGRRKPEKATAREREDGPETEQANRESGKGQAGEAPQDQDNGSISEIRAETEQLTASREFRIMTHEQWKINHE
jgi:hypothetical protein